MKYILFMIICLLMIKPVFALQGQLGDIMLLYAPNPITDPTGIKAEREATKYEKALLHMKVPQYVMGDRIRDESLIRNEFFYHIEICKDAHEYTESWGMVWRKYEFTDYAIQKLCVSQVIAIHDWIINDNAWRYKLPLEEVRQLYIHYAQGHFNWTQIPVELMIGIEYGQTLEDYTNFEDFYSVFMNKHHYCITAVWWSIMKSMYDRGDDLYKTEIEKWLSDPRTVQSLDTLSASRLIGMLLERGLIRYSK